MQPDCSDDPADSSLAGHKRGCAKESIAAPTMNFCERILAKEHQRRCGDGPITTSPDDDETTSRTTNISSKILTSRMTQTGCRTRGHAVGAAADTPTLHGFRFVLSRVPSSSRFRPRLKYLRGSDFNYVGNQTECSGTAVPLRGVAFPLIFRVRGFHAANIQADADLHTLSSHHRDAMHDMRRADAARIDRTARPQLQSADLSLRSLRFRRELFEGDVDRRNAPPNSASRSKL
jgi:hypothetical protein